MLLIRYFGEVGSVTVTCDLLHVTYLMLYLPLACSICLIDQLPVFELPGGWGVEPPTSSCRPPYLWSKFDPRGVEFQPPPHLGFAEFGMLLDSHFLLIMQFLKYL